MENKKKGNIREKVEKFTKNNGIDSVNTKKIERCNPSKKILELAEIYEGNKFKAGDRKDEEKATKDLANLVSLEDELLKNKEVDNKTIENMEEKINKTVENVIEKIAKNRDEKLSGFFGFFRKSDTLQALIDNDVYNRKTKKINFDNFKKYTKSNELKNIGKNSVIDKTTWANIAFGCTLAERLNQAISDNEPIKKILFNKDECSNKWESEKNLMKLLCPNLNSKYLIGKLEEKHKISEKWPYYSSAVNESWGDEKTQKAAKENSDSVPYKIKQTLHTIDKNIEALKQEYLVDYSEVDYSESEKNLDELVECYAMLLVIYQACHTVQAYVVNNKYEILQYYAKDKNIINENYNSFMEKEFSNLYNIDSENFYPKLKECTNSLIKRIQFATCLSAFGLLNIEMSYKKLPEEIKEKLKEAYKNGMGGCEGSRPTTLGDLIEDVEQQVEEAIKILCEYAGIWKDN